MTTVGTLCTGIDMLGIALRHLYSDLDVRWHAEVDPDAARVLAHHQPDVPNLGDITAVDWAAVDAVDVLAATWPCQGNSQAGKRLGKDDERNLWPAVAHAIELQQPSVFLGENVPGLLTVNNGALFGQVLADLDRLGYHAKWTTVGACKIGAPHHRHRVFVAAVRGAANPVGWPSAQRNGSDWVTTQHDLFGNQVGHHEWPQAGEVVDGLMWGRSTVPCDDSLPLLPTMAARDWRSGAANWTDPAGRPLPEVIVNSVARQGWGIWQRAVDRWTPTIGRSVPNPVQPGSGVHPEMSALLPEWMLGLLSGYVTEHVTRKAALRLLGNGVQWQAAALAFSTLLPALPTDLVTVNPMAA